VIEIHYRDFERLVNPRVMPLARWAYAWK